MTPYVILFLAGLVGVLAALAHILTARAETGNPLLAALLAAGFGFFTAATIARDGVMPKVTIWPARAADTPRPTLSRNFSACVM